MNRAAIDPSELGPEGCYKLISGVVVPRPIGWIGTRGASGTANLAPFSFFNVVAGSPPTVLFSGGSVAGRAKDSPSNARSTGVFTVNIVSESLAEAKNASSASVDPSVDEFDLVGLTAVEGDLVPAPMVAEAPVSMECKTTHVVAVGNTDRPNLVVFGEVVRFHIREGVLNGTRVDLDVLQPIGRMSGPMYVRTRVRFEMIRPG
jgi:flavin reductase (DIM6/NTAB) family NADH-FMN oxidoreductase RutF